MTIDPEGAKPGPERTRPDAGAIAAQLLDALTALVQANERFFRLTDGGAGPYAAMDKARAAIASATQAKGAGK